jgi:FkbM family methyltransferase
VSFVRQRFRQSRVLVKRLLGLEPRIKVGTQRPLEFHGNSEGGWKIIQNSLNKDSVVVDVGLGEDASFSESIIEKYGCVVNGFDPTPRAIRYIKNLRNDRLKLFEVGIGSSAGPTHFLLPKNASYVSGSVTPEEHLSQECIEVELVTIGQIFTMLGCGRIDVLKLDVEGTEYEVIDSQEFAQYASRIGQLCVEFHHRWRARGNGSTERAVRTLNGLGFSCAWYSRTTNEEFLFVRPTSAS